MYINGFFQGMTYPNVGYVKSKVLRVGSQEGKIMNRLELYWHELKFVFLR